MKEPELSGKVQQKIDEFEKLELIHPSSDWNNRLMEKVSSVHQYSPTKVSTGAITALVLFLILINVGFILTTLVNNSLKESDRAKDLQIISCELFVNPVSIKI
jgi:hypothetical protein